MPAMIEAHDGVPGFQQPLRHVVVAAEVLAQPVDDDDCRLRLLRRVDASDQQEALGVCFVSCCCMRVPSLGSISWSYCSALTRGYEGRGGRGEEAGKAGRWPRVGPALLGAVVALARGGRVPRRFVAGR